MGASGSGKTTLLSVLAGKAVGLDVNGNVLFNGNSPKPFQERGLVAFVPQQDSLIPYLTVRETLRFAARLKLPKTMKISEKCATVETVIAQVGLVDCSDLIIGDSWRKGISGGEKRRVSVAVQLLLNPSVIILDEPTSGLDAFSAQSIIDMLVSLAHSSKRTVILSIHQPRSEIFFALDQVALLSRGGRLAFAGAPVSALPYFESIGHYIPVSINPADFLIDVVAVDDRDEESEKDSLVRVEAIILAWTRVTEVRVSDTVESRPIPHINKADGAGFTEQTSILIQRMLLNLKHDKLTLWGAFLEAFLIGIVLGVIYFHPEENPTGILSRKAVLNTCNALRAVLVLNFMTFKLVNEMKVFDRERLDKMYSAPAYLIAWCSVHFFVYAILSVIFSLLVYFMASMRTDDFGFHFFIFTMNNVIQQWLNMALSFVAISITRDFSLASLLTQLIFNLFGYSSGFFLPIGNLPTSVKWIHHINYISRGLNLLMVNEFGDHRYICPGVPANDNSTICDGNNLIVGSGFNNDYIIPISALWSELAALLLLAALILHVFPVKVLDKPAGLISKPLKRKENSKGAIWNAVATSIEMEAIVTERIPVTLQLTNAAVSLKSRKYAFSLKPEYTLKPLLQSVTVTFSPGQLTAIIGSSGAGKTTLLNLLHGRTRNSLAPNQTAEISGSILFNGHEYDPSFSQQIIASVRQDNSHLLPGLTTRETLVYAALMRLPNSWSKQRKLRRAEDVMVELGLKECADTIVGGERTKGLSGGQKRRLSVGLALLIDPSVLLLDEPTSGLDAASAKNMILTLKSLAASGRTVICTIHQPRSDIFPLFDRVLLLARGGRVAFSGSQEALVPHLQHQGYTISETENVCDAALDIMSIDFRTKEFEESSSRRIEAIVQAWQPSLDQIDNMSTNIPIDTKSFEKTLIHLYPLLISRSMLNLRRQPDFLIARILNPVISGILMVIFYVNTPFSQAGALTRIGALVGLCTMIFNGQVGCLSIFPRELAMFRFEQEDGTSTVESFLLAYISLELVLDFIGASLTSILIVYSVGLQINVGYVVLVTILNLSIGDSIGMAVCTYFSEPGFAAQISSLLMVIFLQMSGFFSFKMPIFMDWINYVSPLRYVARVLAAKEFVLSVSYSCDSSSTSCLFRTGEDVLKLLGFPTSDYSFALNLLGLIICFLVYRSISYFVLKSKNLY